MSDLDARLLAAHAGRDGPALVALYQEAAATATNETAQAFYLTHALVFALEAGTPEADRIAATLHDMGRH